jgi:hypothetical protein
VRFFQLHTREVAFTDGNIAKHLVSVQGSVYPESAKDEQKQCRDCSERENRQAKVS